MSSDIFLQSPGNGACLLALVWFNRRSAWFSLCAERCMQASHSLVRASHAAVVVCREQRVFGHFPMISVLRSQLGSHSLVLCGIQ